MHPYKKTELLGLQKLLGEIQVVRKGAPSKSPAVTSAEGFQGNLLKGVVREGGKLTALSGPVIYKCKYTMNWSPFLVQAELNDASTKWKIHCLLAFCYLDRRII